VVDDGSNDETTIRAQDAGATVLRQYPNQGKGAALRTAFRRVLEEGCQAVLTLDADGQHDPVDIPKFLHLWETKKPDLIIGARDFSQMPVVRRIANSTGEWLFSWAIGQPIRDNQSGFRLLSRQMMYAALEGQEGGFEFEVETIVSCVERGFHLAWVPIKTIYSGERSHIQPLRHTFHFFRVVWQTRRRRIKQGQLIR
jgi:glycosyltransferase involved in cell wall biosynthesis